MKKLFATIAAIGVIAAGTFATSMATATTASAQAPDATRPWPARHVKAEIFDGVLDGLVVDGVIDDSQAGAIKDAFAAERDRLVEEHGPFPSLRHAFRLGVLRGMMADGVATQAEIDELPEDHPLRTGESPLAALLEDDGQITREELGAYRLDRSRPSRPDVPLPEADLNLGG